jgi:hypothetical protein
VLPPPAFSSKPIIRSCFASGISFLKSRNLAQPLLKFLIWLVASKLPEGVCRFVLKFPCFVTKVNLTQLSCLCICSSEITFCQLTDFHEIWIQNFTIVEHTIINSTWWACKFPKWEILVNVPYWICVWYCHVSQWLRRRFGLVNQFIGSSLVVAKNNCNTFKITVIITHTSGLLFTSLVITPH